MKKLLIPMLLLGWFSVRAQRDSLGEVRRFMIACNAYKQLPVQLQVEIERKVSMPTAKSESSRLDAFFSLRSEGSYIAMEGIEQLVNDSLMLVVNKTTRRMTLLANHQSVSNRMRDYMGMQLGDSAAALMSRKYKWNATVTSGDTDIISASGRVVLPGTTIAKEELRLRLNKGNNQPFEVEQLQRTLVLVSKELYQSVADLPEWTGKTLATPEGGFFLIKEQSTRFRYRTISHDPAGKLPARISDRVTATVGGRYKPVGSYGDYLLTQQF